MIPFGHAWREQFLLDPDVVYLNHGTQGVPPREVLQAQHAIQEELERNPARKLLREPGRLRDAADEVGRFLGARGADLVFVDNVTTATSAVLRSLRFEPGDRIAVTNLGYGSLEIAARVVAEEQQLAVDRMALPFPVAEPREIVDAFAAQLAAGTRLAIVDHVAPQTAMVLPVAEIARVCRERGVLLLVDGAHAPGSLALDIADVGADLYTGNLHKWMWTPRSSGILWARPEVQEWLRPAVISWGHGVSFTAAFDHVGTRDPSPHLAAPAAIRMLERVGPEAVRAYDHDLVWAGACHLAERWGTAVAAPESMVATMAPVWLPDGRVRSPDDARALQRWLADEHHVEVNVYAEDGRSWVRVAAQIYNALGDFERLADAVAER